MNTFGHFLWVVAGQWGNVLSGGVLVAFLWLNEKFDWFKVPRWTYGIFALVAFLPAFFRAWRQQLERADEAEGQLQVIGAPHLLLGWVADSRMRVEPAASASHTWMIENRKGNADAHNIRIDPITLSPTANITATFPMIPLLKAGDKAYVETVLTGEVPENKQGDFEMVFYAADEGPSPFITRGSDRYYITFPIVVSFENYAQTRFRAKFEFRSDDWFGRGKPAEILLKKTEIVRVEAR